MERVIYFGLRCCCDEQQLSKCCVVVVVGRDFWGGKKGEIKRFGREEGEGRMVSMGWRKEKSVSRERVVGKVGREESSEKFNQA